MVMSNDAMREAFEDWCRRNEHDRRQRLDGTGYNNMATARAWAAWQYCTATPHAQAAGDDKRDAERWRAGVAMKQFPEYGTYNDMPTGWYIPWKEVSLGVFDSPNAAIDAAIAAASKGDGHA